MKDEIKARSAVSLTHFTFHLLSFAFSLLFVPGCARAPQPGMRDVPAGLVARPGVYVDVNPRWSHDGQRIAFLRATPDRLMQMRLADAQLTDIHALMPPELLCPDRPYSANLQRYSSPDTLAWSPDDQQIAFERIAWSALEDGQRLPGTGIWTLNLATQKAQAQALPPSGSKDADKLYYFHTPCWSPDGRRLAFVGEGVNGQRMIFVRPLLAGGRSLRPTENAPRFDTYADSDWPAWKGEGGGGMAFRQGIVHALAAPPTETLRLLSPGNPRPGSAQELWRMRARDLRKKLTGYAPDLEIAPRAGHLAWSPDGTRLAFTLTPDANDYSQYALWVVKADGTGARRVSPPDSRGYLAPVWIGNAQLGALSPHQERESGERFDVVLCELNTVRKRLLGTINSSDCDWSPDRRHIAYAMPPDARPRSPQNTTLQMFSTGL